MGGFKILLFVVIFNPILNFGKMFLEYDPCLQFVHDLSFLRRFRLLVKNSVSHFRNQFSEATNLAEVVSFPASTTLKPKTEFRYSRRFSLQKDGSAFR
jgi:hypothetical protein